MASRTINFEVVPYYLFDTLSKHRNVDYYANITAMCVCNRNSPPAWQEYYAECADMLESLDGDEIEFFAEELLEPDAFLEMGFRYLTGCGTSMFSIEGALYMFDPLTDELRTNPDRYVGDTAPPDVRAKAHSGAAFAYYLEYAGTDSDFEERYLVQREYFGRLTEDPEGFEGRLGSLFLAVRHANASVVLGLASAAALSVGVLFKEIAEKFGIDVERTGKYQPLWRAVKTMKLEMEAEKRKDEKRGEAGSPYVCAAPDCKIQGVHKSALRVCGGKCPSGFKPHYCSKECQRKDWPRHKALCKQGHSDEGQLAGALASFLKPEQNADANVNDLQETEEQPWVDWRRIPGPARMIEIPDGEHGETLRVISTTMSPKEMRDFRERMIRRQGTSSAGAQTQHDDL